MFGDWFMEIQWNFLVHQIDGFKIYSLGHPNLDAQKLSKCLKMQFWKLLCIIFNHDFPEVFASSSADFSLLFFLLFEWEPRYSDGPRRCFVFLSNSLLWYEIQRVVLWALQMFEEPVCYNVSSQFHRQFQTELHLLRGLFKTTKSPGWIVSFHCIFRSKSRL